MTKTTSRNAPKLCGGCNGDFSAPGIRPSKTPGMCRDCAPDHTIHLAIAGTHYTLCGKPTRNLGAGHTAKVHDPLFGSTADVNCTGCIQVLQLRNKRRH